MTAWRSNALPRMDTLLLVLLASAALTVVRPNASWTPALMAVRAAIEVAVAIGLSLLLRRRARSLSQARGFAVIAVFVAVVYPFVADHIMRRFSGGSEPLEILVLTSLQLTAVVLAVFCHLPRLGGSAVLLSSFLLLFVTSMASNLVTLVLASIYGMLALWWLMGAYWDRLDRAFVASTVERRIPVRVSVISGTAAVLLLLAAFSGVSDSAAVSLQGFFPTSGGARWHDPDARSGVGDGDAIVAAEDDAMSFGPVESELFLESDMPTLYDTFNEVYGEPPDIKKNLDRAIAISRDEVKHTHQRIAKTQRSGREFSTVRRKPKRRQQLLDDRSAPAMLYVAGRVPLHLAMERFDTFDGRVWTHSGLAGQYASIRLQQENGKPWAYVAPADSSPIFRGLEPHALKFINLKTNRFPSPPQLAAVHIDKVDKRQFFGWTADGVACMPVREHIPQLTVAHIRSHGVNLQSLREADFTTQFLAVTNETLVDEQTETDGPAKLLARHLDVAINRETISQVAAEWTRDVPRGWRQVEMVVERLRHDFSLDSQARPPEDCKDVVSHFLQARRGPNYLFATTAAMVLRELGYPTRMVTGFYADEDRYQSHAGQTAVLAEDVHVWVEVNTGNGTWVPIEPTPGYEPPNEVLTWRQWWAMVIAKCAEWVARHTLPLLLGLALSISLFLTRRVWLDAMAFVVCRLMGLRSVRARLRWTLRLLEWRAWLAGRSRPTEATVATWYAPLYVTAPATTRPALGQFRYWIDRLLYAPSEIDLTQKRDIALACRSAISAYTVKSLRTNILLSIGGDR